MACGCGGSSARQPRQNAAQRAAQETPRPRPVVAYTDPGFKQRPVPVAEPQR